MRQTNGTQTMKRAAETKNAGTLGHTAVVEISDAFKPLLADVFALYVKTKNFHWHIGGPQFRDYHLLLDEQAQQIFEMTDEIAERARKLGGTTLHSISEISEQQRIHDNNEESVPALEMLEELRSDNLRLAGFLRTTHELCAKHGDVASTSMIEIWLDQTERRAWFLREIVARDSE